MPPPKFHLFSPFPPEALDFAAAVERAGRMIATACQGLGATHGLPVATWRLLSILSGSNGSMSYARLARPLHVSRQVVRAMARELRESGLVATTTGPVNRKDMRLVLTRKGALALAEIDEAMRAFLLEMTSDISRAELTAAARLFNRLSARIRRCETLMRK